MELKPLPDNEVRRVALSENVPGRLGGRRVVAVNVSSSPAGSAAVILVAGENRESTALDVVESSAIEVDGRTWRVDEIVPGDRPPDAPPGAGGGVVRLSVVG